MLAISIAFVRSCQDKQRGSGTIGAALPVCKRLQHHLRTLLGYKTSEKEYKFQIAGDIPVVTKASRGRQFRGYVNPVAAHHNLSVRNASVQQFLTFLLSSRNQAGRTTNHDIANNNVVDTF